MPLFRKASARCPLQYNSILTLISSEGLRIYSAQPSPLDRVVPPAHGPLRILGYDLPAGTIVASQAWSIHREASVFLEPDHFNPDRWIEGAIAAPSEPQSTQGGKLASFGY